MDLCFKDCWFSSIKIMSVRSRTVGHSFYSCHGFYGFRAPSTLAPLTILTGTHSFCHFIGWWSSFIQPELLLPFLLVIQTPGSKNKTRTFKRNIMERFLPAPSLLLLLLGPNSPRMPRYWPRGDPATRETAPDVSSWKNRLLSKEFCMLRASMISELHSGKSISLGVHLFVGQDFLIASISSFNAKMFEWFQSNHWGSNKEPAVSFLDGHNNLWYWATKHTLFHWSCSQTKNPSKPIRIPMSQVFKVGSLVASYPPPRKNNHPRSIRSIPRFHIVYIHRIVTTLWTALQFEDESRAWGAEDL